MKTKIILLLVSIFLMPLFASASIDKNLYYGLQNDSQVEELQDFLIDQGYLTGEATGNYFSLTLSAVKKFQTANDLPSTGYFGKLSRQKVNDILSNNLQSSNQQSITEEEQSSSNISNTTSNNVSRESLIALLQKLLNNQTQNNQQVQQQIQEQSQPQSQSQQQSSTTSVVESSSDVCVNIEGIQTVVPGGMTASGNVCIIDSTIENPINDPVIDNTPKEVTMAELKTSGTMEWDTVKELLPEGEVIFPRLSVYTTGSQKGDIVTITFNNGSPETKTVEYVSGKYSMGVAWLFPNLKSNTDYSVVIKIERGNQYLIQNLIARYTN